MHQADYKEAGENPRSEMPAREPREPREIESVPMTPVTIRLPDRLWTEIDAEAKRTGHSRNTITYLLIDDQLKEIKRPRLEKYSILEDRFVVLWDNSIREIVSLYILGSELKCDRDVGRECEHIRFAKDIPKVQTILEENT